MATVKRTQLSALWCVLCVAVCFLIGGVSGCLLGVYAAEAGAEEVSRYLCDFLALVRAREGFWTAPSVLWNRGRWLLCCGIFGLSAAGVVILPVLFGLRGFLLAFGVSCFVRTFGAAGLLPAALLYGVPAILWGPGFLLLGALCLRRSSYCLRKDEYREGACKGGYASGILFALCVVFECALLPRLLSAAAYILE